MKTRERVDVVVTNDQEAVVAARTLARDSVSGIVAGFEEDSDLQMMLERALERFTAITELLETAGRPVDAVVGECRPWSWR